MTPLLNRSNLFLLIVFISGILLYLPSVNIPYVNDELAFITRNEAGNLQEFLNLFQKKDYDGFYYRPLPNFVSGILTAAIGYEYQYYRIFNLLLHSFNGVLVFSFIMLLLRVHERKELIALFGALFFLAIPVNDYAVIWHTDLFDRLMFTFYLLSIFYFLNKNAWNTLSLLFFLLSVLSKEMAFSLPVVIFLLTLFSESQSRINKAVKQSLPYFLLLFAYVTFRWIAFDNNIFDLQDPHSSGGFLDSIKNIVMFSGILIFPFFLRETQNFVANYPLLVFSAASILAALFFFYIYRQRRKDMILFFLLLFLIISILPASRLLMRWYLYLPSAVFASALAYIIFSSAINIKTAITAGLLIFISYYSYTLYRQTRWIEVAKKGEASIIQLKQEYLAELHNSTEIKFLTVPAKVDDIPLFQLAFDDHLRHYIKSKGRIEVLTRSFLNNFDDEITLDTTGEMMKMSHSGDNYFMLSGSENYIKFNPEDLFEGKIRSIYYLKEKEPYKTIFTFSHGKFHLLKE